MKPEAASHARLDAATADFELEIRLAIRQGAIKDNDAAQAGFQWTAILQENGEHWIALLTVRKVKE
jgi:hypothetical protein